ncbi:uncharacterized protein LOC123561301 [Mercenaria mercenaria]|uniref:uncharacterized protein LOC123561301 n=1 Tax=Mercenaria mercenaria TaxID=6596 RepID=UPI00234F001F|nr:uncharacterized protein LOC123561301 [Mercenaria mercenaria]
MNKKDKNIVTNPDMVPYSHNPPGHTCGLPCCSKDLQVHLRERKTTRSCIGIQDHDILAQNFIFKGKLKNGPGLENGFFSVQEAKETPHAEIPKFGSVRGLPAISEEQKNYTFLKGRGITLPEAEDPHATEKLYLEDFNIGESDDLEDFEIKGYDSGIETIRENEIDYYITVKSPLDPEKGVPYDPKDIASSQMYPWELLKDLKDNLSNKTTSEKGDDSSSSNYYSSGSNYYEVISYSDEKPLLKKDKNETAVVGKNDSKHDTCSQQQQKGSKTFIQGEPLPALPPKPPVQNQFNHPPLKKPNMVKPVDSLQVISDNNYDIQSDSDSSQTKYNMYSSVCSITGMANQMSREAYERFMSLDRASVTQKSYRRDIRDLDFMGNYMPIGNKNLDLAVTKAKLNQLFKDKKDTTLMHKEGKNIKTTEENIIKNDDICKDVKRNSLKPGFVTEGMDQLKNELKEKLMDSDHLSQNPSDDEEEDDTDDENGIINPGFKHINVDGKFLGSRHSLDRESSFGEEICDRFLHLWESGDEDSVNDDEMKVMELLKERLRNVDNTEGSPSGESFNDNPVTLIL